MMTITTLLWMGWKMIRGYKFRGIPLLIASLQVNSIAERTGKNTGTKAPVDDLGTKT